MTTPQKKLIIDGEYVPYQGVEGHPGIVHGQEQGLWWGRNSKNTAGTHRNRLWVWHHQAGEGSAPTLFRVLDKRGLSVNLQIDPEGTITQMADMKTHCFHAGAANRWGGGVEIANLGRAKMSRRIRNYFKRLGYQREIYTDRVHGREIQFFRFLPEQMLAALEVTLAIEETLGIPQRWKPTAGERNKVIRTTFDYTKHHGHIGHMHVTKNKIGPSPHLMDELHNMMSMVSR